MLRTRLWMGALLIGLAVGALIVDRWLAPWYPFLLVIVLALSLLACLELLHLLRAARFTTVKSETGAAPPNALCPQAWLCYTAVAVVVLANWPAHLPGGSGDAWPWVTGAFAATVLTAFLTEMATFREPGTSVLRMALAVWTVSYLGLLPSFFAQLRWLPGLTTEQDTTRGSLALALAIFVPKFGDVGAYFTGRFLGRHRMTPLLSPKKTWEGAAGAMVASVLTAVGLDALGPVLRGGVWAAVGFGLSVGLIGLLGDLAESLIKRDCGQKDASQIMPGFGGVLDVVDAVIFAAPVAYWWLR
jgi:phosphatidate cytidylyltransferase